MRLFFCAHKRQCPLNSAGLYLRVRKNQDFFIPKTDAKEGGDNICKTCCVVNYRHKKYYSQTIIVKF
ncbi:MAG: hypothetical protein LBB59_04340, partial [Campylobacteraceae bacterium]|nr:hypothetical protein [Campylobacteraceae bacterium]